MHPVKNKEGFLLRMQKKIVLIYSDSPVYHSGYGILISENGYILTASHLFESDSEEVDVGCNGVRYIAKVIKIKREFDLALLKIIEGVSNGRRKLKFEYARIGKRVRIGQKLNMILSLDEHNFSYTSGLVSFERRLRSDITDAEKIRYISKETCFVQGHGLHGTPGCSGTPVFDSRGRIIGIYNTGYRTMDLLVHLTLLKKMCRPLFLKKWNRAVILMTMRPYKVTNFKCLKQEKQKKQKG